MKFFDQEPYAVFFPLGLLSASLGVLLWVFVSLGIIVGYPNVQHASIMVFGFLMSFVTGFLMTAAPRMSGTEPAGKIEIIVGASILSTSFVLSYLFPSWGQSFQIVQIVFLLYFIFSRYIRRRQNPPAIFVFIPVGLISGIIGILASLLFNLQFLTNPDWFFYSKLLMYQSLILNLIVGLGSRLIPVLSRVSGALTPDQQVANQGLRFIFAELIILNISFIVEAFFSQQLGLAVRIMLLIWVFISKFKILSKRTRKGNLGAGLRFSCWLMLASYTAMLFYPDLYNHLLHGVLIGGFTVITLSVAVRVVIAHGGFSLDEELRSRPIIIVSVLMTLATLIRVFARDHKGLSYLGHLGVASVIFQLAIIFWYVGFGKKLKNSGHER